MRDSTCSDDPTGQERDVSISQFVLDHYGREVLDYIAEPMLAGVYGGDPAEMSALSVVPQFVKWEAKYGSLTRATWKELKGGNGADIHHAEARTAIAGR